MTKEEYREATGGKNHNEKKIKKSFLKRKDEETGSMRCLISKRESN
jgi:hypothetical protein